MAKAKRNLKTHPNATGDDDPGDDTSPERTDLRQSADSGGEELVDVFGKPEVVEAGAVDDKSGAAVDEGTATSEGEVVAPRKESTRVVDDTRNARRPADTGRRPASTRDGDEEGSYSARVRKRVARERAATNRERALREQAEAKLLEERTARQATEDRLGRLERAQQDISGNQDVKALESQIAAIAPQLEAATEAGDTKKVLALTIKLGELQADLRVLKYDLKRQNEDAARAALKQPTAAERAAEAARTATPIVGQQESADWIAVNAHWWNRPKYKAAVQDTKDADKALLKEVNDGDHDFEPYTEEYFEEIARRVQEAHPDLEICDREGEPYDFTDDEEGETVNDRTRNGGGGRQNQRAPVRGRAPMGQGGQGQRRQATPYDLAKQGKVVLTDADYAQMRTFKMDPKNPEHKKAFAKERVRTLLTAGPGDES